MTYSHPTTIGMRAAEMSDWLKRRPEDAATLALRKKLIADKPTDVLALLPVAEPAVLELGRARELSGSAMDVLKALGQTYAEDICILTNGDNAYLLTAGVLCFPNRWRLAEKAGKPIIAVHAPVPEYAEKLSPQVDFFLDRLRPGRCFMRANWGLASTDTLHLPDPIAPVNPLTDTDFFLRHEGQSFVKLPETGAVVFTIRTTLTPWSDVPTQDRKAILNQISGLSPDWLAYKSIQK